MNAPELTAAGYAQMVDTRLGAAAVALDGAVRALRYYEGTLEGKPTAAFRKRAQVLKNKAITLGVGFENFHSKKRRTK